MYKPDSIEPEADELATNCEMDLRLLLSIAISTKRIADILTQEKDDDAPRATRT
jgi:hypothetical protein